MCPATYFQLQIYLGVQVKKKTNIKITIKFFLFFLKGTKNGNSNIFENKNIVAIECGKYHTLLLNKEGDLYSFGSNSYGQCGVLKPQRGEDYISLSQCRKIDFSNGKSELLMLQNNKMNLNNKIEIKSIHSGPYHTFIITDRHGVFGWGCNTFGMLGNGVLKPWSGRPQKVVFDERAKLDDIISNDIIDIMCEMCVSIFVSKNFGYYFCGDNSTGKVHHFDRYSAKSNLGAQIARHNGNFNTPFYFKICDGQETSDVLVDRRTVMNF